MKRKYLSVALVSVLLVAGCDKEEDPVIPATGIKATTDTIRVAYGGTVSLSSYFSIEPEGAVGTLIYSIADQPEFAEGDDAWQPVGDVYSVSGDVLTSGNIRVPDTLDFPNEGRTRWVREGHLKVELTGSTITTLTKLVTIVQTDKPALTPVISVNSEITGLDRNKLTLQTTADGQRLFNATYFTILPIDFSESDIRVGIGAGSYITMAASGVPQAGGVDADAGTGGFVVAYYKGNTLDEVLDDESLPQAKLYVDVEYVETNPVVGIELRTDIGQCNVNSFWRNNSNGSQFAYNFIKMKLKDGNLRAYDGQTDSGLGLLVGDFNEYLQGIGTESATHAGWFPKVSLKTGDPVGSAALPENGTPLTFKVTSGAHFEEAGWTVTVTTVKVNANPGVCN